MDTNWAPDLWQQTLAEWRETWESLGQPVPDGTPGVRDRDAPCEHYAPVDLAHDVEAHGDCETDGHYLCADGRSVCEHISEGALRRHRDRCETCGTALVARGHCPSCESEFASTTTEKDQ